MPCLHAYARALSALVCAAVLAGGISGCSRNNPPQEQAEVAQAFLSWKSAVIGQQTSQAMAYIPSHVDDYLSQLNASAGPSADAPAAKPASSQSPGVDHLLRTALVRKVPPELRTNLTLETLWQRITDRHLFNPRDMREIDLGRVSVNGNRASAEIYYQGTLTALQLPFVKEGEVWKIDVMAILPYAEVLMRVDRAIKGETENQQVDELVSKLPSL
jgi:hypothetical protein